MGGCWCYEPLGDGGEGDARGDCPWKYVESLSRNACGVWLGAICGERALTWEVP